MYVKMTSNSNRNPTANSGNIGGSGSGSSGGGGHGHGHGHGNRSNPHIRRRPTPSQGPGHGSTASSAPTSAPTTSMSDHHHQRYYPQFYNPIHSLHNSLLSTVSGIHSSHAHTHAHAHTHSSDSPAHGSETNSNKYDTSKFYPIWALAAVSKSSVMDHSTAATRTSTSATGISTNASASANTNTSTSTFKSNQGQVNPYNYYYNYYNSIQYQQQQQQLLPDPPPPPPPPPMHLQSYQQQYQQQHQRPPIGNINTTSLRNNTRTISSSMAVGGTGKDKGTSTGTATPSTTSTTGILLNNTLHRSTTTTPTTTNTTSSMIMDTNTNTINLSSSTGTSTNTNTISTSSSSAATTTNVSSSHSHSHSPVSVSASASSSASTNNIQRVLYPSSPHGNNARLSNFEISNFTYHVHGHTGATGAIGEGRRRGVRLRLGSGAGSGSTSTSASASVSASGLKSGSGAPSGSGLAAATAASLQFSNSGSSGASISGGSASFGVGGGGGGGSNSGSNSNSASGGLISSSEFSQKKKWIRSGNKWVLTGTSISLLSGSGGGSGSGSGSGSRSNSAFGTNASRSGSSIDLNYHNSSSSILAEIGGSLPTVHSTESSTHLDIWNTNTGTNSSNLDRGGESSVKNTNGVEKQRQPQHLQNRLQPKRQPFTKSSSASSISTTSSTTTVPTSIASPWVARSNFNVQNKNATTSKKSPLTSNNYKTLHNNNNNNNNKVDPTAVSSYGSLSSKDLKAKSSPPQSTTTRKTISSNSFKTPAIASSPLSTSSKHQHSFQSRNTLSSPYNTTPKNNNDSNNGNSTPSVISSSPSLLYARRRLATTPGGFPYMPCLHLTRSSSSYGDSGNNGHGSSTGNSDVNSNITSGHLNWNLKHGSAGSNNNTVEKARLTAAIASSSVLASSLNATYENPNINNDKSIAVESEVPSAENIASIADRKRTDGDVQRVHNERGDKDPTLSQNAFSTSSSFVQRLQEKRIQQNEHLQSISQSDSKPESIIDFDSSEYDSESNNIGERLKEWKEKYVKNVIIKDINDKEEIRKDVKLKKPKNERKISKLESRKMTVTRPSFRKNEMRDALELNETNDEDDDDDDGCHEVDPISLMLKREEMEQDIEEHQKDSPPTTATVMPTTATTSSSSSRAAVSISSPRKLSSNSRAFSDSFRSIDSGYDSESNNIVERLKEWKEEQYKKSGVVVEHSLSNEDKEKGRRKIFSQERGGNVDIYQQKQHRQRATTSPASPLSRLKLLRNQSDSPLYHDTGYESGSTTCDNERLEEWKEQQYKNLGIIRKSQLNNDVDNPRHPTLSNPAVSTTGSSVNNNSNTWELPFLRSLDSFDSEEPNNREERLKEWKQRFVNLPMQEKNLLTGRTLNDESDNDNESKQPLTTINSSTTGFFPVTSPGRRKRLSTPKRAPNHGLSSNLHASKSSGSKVYKVRSSKPSPVSPPSTVRRDYVKTTTTGNLPIQPTTVSTSLPPLTPPRFQTRTTPSTVTYPSDSANAEEKNDSVSSQQNKPQSVPNTTNFLFNFAQPMSSSFSAQKSQEDRKDNDESSNALLCSPSSTNINTPCQVIPKLPSTDSALEVESPPSHDTKKSSSLQILKSADLWKPIRSHSSSGVSIGDHDSNCSLNPHDSTSYFPFRGNKDKSRKEASSANECLFSWENCLHVRAEGARTGRICLSSTHLIFIYEDDAAESTLFENGWNKKKIDVFLQAVNGLPVRGATPLNVPPDESGEGGGVEVIGTDENGVDFFDMLEDGFKETEPISLTEEEKENFTEAALSFDEIKCEVDKNQSVSSGLYVNYDDVQNNIIKEDASMEGESNLRITMKNNQMNDDTFGDDIPRSCMSTSSSYSSCLSDDSSTKDETRQSAPEGSLCEDSYEYMLNECIVRAMKAEAQRRLTEHGGDESSVLSPTASNNVWDKLDINRSDTNNEFGSLIGNQTNVSSFSEPDLEIDPDEERRLYISEAKDSKDKFVGMKWSLNKLAELYDRRYMTREVALEIFSPSPSPSTTLAVKRPSSTASVSTAGGLTIEEVDVPLGPLSKESVFLVVPDIEGAENDEHASNRFGRAKKRKSRRDDFVETLKDHALNLCDVHWQNAKTLNRLWVNGGVASSSNDEKTRSWTPASLFRRRNGKSDALYLLTRAWRKGLISNYDYLLRLNAISGRSFHDPGNYPVMPWVLSNFVSSSVPDLSDERNYRDLTKPMGALNPERLNKFLDKYATLCSVDYAIPPFMYGSHYSNTGGVVLHYLVRKRPFAGLHRQLQGGQFDIPDRLFRSVNQTWEICSRKSATEVKELTPEWYSDSSFLKNDHDFNLGTSVDGSTISDVVLPPWANNDASKFIEVMRNALESDHCSAKLPAWIDLIFGYKQRGPEAEKANNVFYHLSYYDSEDLDKVEDKTLRAEIELHIADFGNCPAQLFFKPHPNKKTESLATQLKVSFKE